MNIRHEIRDLLRSLDACSEATTWADQWATSGSSLTAWEACERSDWMIWLLARTTVGQDGHRLRLMACDFAEAVLHLVPAGEDRPRKAIEASRAFCAGTITRKEMAAAGAAARDAAWAAAGAGAAAWAAVRAAAFAAAGDAAWDAAWAAARAAAWDAAGDAQANIIRKYFPTCPPLKPF